MVVQMTSILKVDSHEKINKMQSNRSNEANDCNNKGNG